MEFGYISEKNVAVEKAHKSGKEEGEKIETGQKIGIIIWANEKAVEITKKMLADGMSVKLAAKYSGLSIEEIKRL